MSSPSVAAAPSLPVHGAHSPARSPLAGPAAAVAAGGAGTNSHSTMAMGIQRSHSADAQAKLHQQQQQPYVHPAHQAYLGHPGSAHQGYTGSPSPYSAPAQQMYFAPQMPIVPGFNAPSGSPGSATGSPGQAIYSPEMQAMMHAALQQQHAHFQSQMAAMAAHQQQHNDQRRRAPSLPNMHSQLHQHQQQQYFPQQMPLQPQMYPLQPTAQPFHPHAFHHASSSTQSPIKSVHAPPHAAIRERAATANAASSPSNPGMQYAAHSYPVPQAPFAVPPRSASPSGRPSAEQVRRRTESNPNDPRFQPPASAQSRGRTDSSRSEQQQLSRHHSPSNSISQPASSPSLQPSSALAIPPPRIRADSSLSSGSGSSSLTRSASPTVSDRAPTPTQAQAGPASSGRTTPTPIGLPSTASSSRLATLAGNSASSGLQPAVRIVNHASSPSLHAHGAGIPRKASPLSQQSNRSTTPTQASPFVNGHDRDGSDDEGNESDGTASNRPVQPAPPRPSQGHKSTLSNASSAMGSSASGSSPHTPSSSSSHSHGKSIFKNKLRKALSLNELSSSASTSSMSVDKHGRSSLTSNSSSDASTSNEPRTPPNGASPVLPSRFAASSATNLHSGHGQSASAGTGSLPTDPQARRRFGILNSKMNSSTDNISISSTVSSASMMLRKMGNLGKLARKSSVRSLSNIFHRGDKERDNGTASDAVSEFGVPGAAMTNSKEHRKKGNVADPAVSHATAEVEAGASVGGMTPAAALVRKHQLREAEEEAKRRAAAQAAAAASVESPRSKLLEKEKERLKNAAANGGGKKLGDKKKWGFGGFSRSASSTSLRQDALNAAAGASAAPPAGASRTHTPSPPSSAAPSPVFDSPNMSAQGSASSIEHKEHAEVRPSLDGIQFDTWRRGAAPAKFTSGGQEESEDDEGFDDRTPRGSIEILGEQPYDDWDGEPPNGASFFDDDTASFTNGSASVREGSITMHAEPEEYDDGGHDGRYGQKVPERPPRHARPVKGILKYARSYSQENLMKPQPTFLRPRASSYDAPHQTSPPNQPGKLAALAQVIPSGDQVDGVATHTSTSARLDTHAHGDSDSFSSHSPSSPNGKSGPYSNASFNTSAPILSNFASQPMTQRAMTGPQVKRRISFAHNLSVHTTWAGNIYDRRGEPATCNRLTPQLAQRIKEELNAFKMEEMEVHHMSRNLTHFFV